eukprot:1511163-Rhodomonas_salina.2
MLVALCHRCPVPHDPATTYTSSVPLVRADTTDPSLVPLILLPLTLARYHWSELSTADPATTGSTYPLRWYRVRFRQTTVHYTAKSNTSNHLCRSTAPCVAARAMQFWHLAVPVRHHPLPAPHTPPQYRTSCRGYQVGPIAIVYWQEGSIGDSIAGGRVISSIGGTGRSFGSQPAPLQLPPARLALPARTPFSLRLRV